QMGKLRLSLAMYPYDRMLPLKDGTVQPEGIDLNFISMPPGDTFWRQLHHSPEFDVSEISLSGYLITLELPIPPLVAIPVFPSRNFRHSCIFVHTDSGIAGPAALHGKRVGLPEYSMTAALWIRGVLQDDYGVDLRSIRYVRGGLERYGAERIA